MKALLLAAGKGTRISHLTQTCPKPMLPFAGRPLLEHLVTWLRGYGIVQLAINLHYLPEVITDHFGDGRPYGVEITYSYEATLLGTAGAARRLQNFLDETFVVIFGDIYTNFDLSKLVRFHWSKQVAGGSALTLALYHVSNPTECGLVELGTGGRVTQFVEKPPAHAVFTDLANTGILICEPSVLELIPEDVSFDFGRDLLPLLLEHGLPVYGLEIAEDEFVVDIGTPAGYARAQQSVALALA